MIPFIIIIILLTIILCIRYKLKDDEADVPDANHAWYCYHSNDIVIVGEDVHNEILSQNFKSIIYLGEVDD